MPELDPAMARILDAMRAENLPPYESMTPAQARTEAERRNAFWNRAPVPLARVEELAFPGPRGDVRIRLYADGGGSAPLPCVVYLHGGGWVFGSLDTHDNACRRLARAGRFMVASVDYGLAPEQPFPQGLEDAVAAVLWLRQESGRLGIDPERLAVAGDSAGANLALALALIERDAGVRTLKAAGLVYGAFAADFETTSYAAFGGGQYILSTATMRWFWDQYAPNATMRRNPLAAPLHADLTGLPPLLVAAAEFDPLRDDSERLARRLIDVGAELDYRLWRGITHASFNMSRMLPAADRCIEEVAGFLARHLR